MKRQPLIMTRKAIFYHARCKVCISAEQSWVTAILAANQRRDTRQQTPSPGKWGLRSFGRPACFRNGLEHWKI